MPADLKQVLARVLAANPTPVGYNERQRAKARERMRRWRERHPTGAAEAMARWRARNPGVAAERMAAYRAADPSVKERERQYDKDRYWADPEANRQRAQRWKDLNPEKVRAKRIAWWAANPGARNAARMAYHARKLRAMPIWANMEVIVLIYSVAKELSLFEGVEYEVDHIVPLQSKIVCGLHVEHNLRIVPMNENRRKLNKFEE
jgi:hypothetical protein